VTVPSNPLCAVEGFTATEGGSVTTKPLVVEADYMIEARNFVRFAPKEGTTFATVKIVKGTGACPIMGSYPVTGSVFGESLNLTGVEATMQGIKFTAAINTEAGGELKVKAEPATLTGAATAGTSLATMGFFTS
jgi:hypothetical protein